MKDSRLRNCFVCGKPFRPDIRSTEDVCRHWQCQQKAKMERQIQRRHAEARSRAESLERRIEQAMAIRDQSKLPSGESDRASFRPVIIPANQRALISLPRRRRYRFTKRLLRLTEQIGSEEPEESSDDLEIDLPRENEEELLPVLGAACATCRGKCCDLGGTHAFVDRNVVQRLMKTQGTSDPVDIVSRYVEKLPEKSYAGSCVFHSEFGCTLTREMRSNTCNNTICGGLVELRNRIEVDGESQFFLAATANEKVERTQFVNAEESGPPTSQQSD